jgi:hypothetical protein
MHNGYPIYAKEKFVVYLDLICDLKWWMADGSIVKI